MYAPHRLALATATAAALTGGLFTFAAASASAADSVKVAHADFNGDGYGDIVAGTPGSYVGGLKKAGQVAVLYGGASGVSGARHTTLSQNSAGVPGTSEANDGFGYAQAYGDFNGDGYDDLAVGTPGEKVGSDANGGTVALLWGSKSGLTGKGVTLADPAPSSHDKWGQTLASGDFDGDGRADLVVGSTAATLYVYRGGFTASGTAPTRSTFKLPIHPGTADYSFGPVHLVAGDVNGDGRSDLVVNGWETKTAYGFNTNYWLPGTASGLSASSVKTLRSGIVTGIGDINGDGYGDIVSGVGWDAGTLDDGTTIPDASTGGRVNITYGSASGPASTAVVNQDTGNVPGGSEKGDEFGWDLDLGDVNGDGYQDIAIGSPFENLGGVTDTGQVTVLYGSPSGVNTTSGGQALAQSTAGVPGSDEKNDHFGMDVKLDDVNGDGRADLVVGSDENSGNGSVTYLPSTGTKITATGSHLTNVGDAGISTSGTPELGASFAN
ncbi:FG-GAP and VCBS repeat-containing protein [Streptomyces sp. LaPpAH-108]|uniref:FG-GAP and VCBS repeat-containing protein n=1 Tax=Streptomyces sp. LaPpAH-108 TaxID=1155714 RepID=UPI00037EFB4F|nr:FG-GAP and VCBS repeat-containing protein [Streptomyces sp. LaPpAH-108]